MSTLDFYKLTDLDTSLILNYPRTMSGVLTAAIDMLSAKGKLIVDESNLTVDAARKISREAVRDTTTYYLVRDVDAKVWAALREAVNEDRIRVLGVIHGDSPSTLPDNAVIIDIGKSLHRKVSGAVASAIEETILKRGTMPQGKPEEVYTGLQALCYEVLYSPEGRMFNRKVANKVPRSLAFKLLYNPPTSPTENHYRSEISRFLQEVRG